MPSAGSACVVVGSDSCKYHCELAFDRIRLLLAKKIYHIEHKAARGKVRVLWEAKIAVLHLASENQTNSHSARDVGIEKVRN